jgi:hypothetical protein
MRSKERCLAALNLSRVDKVPLFEFLDSRALIKSITGKNQLSKGVKKTREEVRRATLKTWTSGFKKFQCGGGFICQLTLKK